LSNRVSAEADAREALERRVMSEQMSSLRLMERLQDLELRFGVLSAKQEVSGKSICVDLTDEDAEGDRCKSESPYDLLAQGEFRLSGEGLLVTLSNDDLSAVGDKLLQECFDEYVGVPS